METKELDILKALEPDVEKILEKHTNSRGDWYPHEFIPWYKASNLLEGDYAYNKEKVPEGVVSALYLNLLTEDNLPWYVKNISRIFGPENDDTVWGHWLQQWTAEEENHSYVMRNYITLNGLMDPKELEDARFHQVKNAVVPEHTHASQGIIYGALQELGGRHSYRNAAKEINDPEGYKILAKIASDENRHHIFYRDVAKKGFEFFPSQFVISLHKQIVGFKMPGTGILNYEFHSSKVAEAGIFTLEMRLKDVNEHLIYDIWKVDQLTNLTPEAEKAREELFSFMEKSIRIMEKQKEREARKKQKLL